MVAYAYDHLTSDSTVKPPLVSSTILLGRGLHAKRDDNVPTPWMPARISLSILSFMKVQQTLHIESPWLFSVFIFLSDRCQQDLFCLRFFFFLFVNGYWLLKAFITLGYVNVPLASFSSLTIHSFFCQRISEFRCKC